MVVLHHKRGELGIELTEDGDITIAHLVEHTDDRTLAIGGVVGSLECTDVRDVAVVAYRIIIDVVAHFLYQTVVAHCDVSQGGIVDA